MSRILLILIVATLHAPLCSGQSVDEIINGSITKTGGASNWTALKGIKIKAKFDQGGIEFPLEIVQLADGRQYTRLTFQNTEIKQGVFDGSTLWSTDFQTLKAKQADEETTANVGNDSNDFPDALLNYSNKGYGAELLGKELLEGIEVYKIKLEKEPITVDGVQVADISYYYFDSKTLLPVALEFEVKHGPIQGSTMVITLKDYREVQGLLFPFSLSQGVKDAPSQPLVIESIEINPTINSNEFIYPNK